MASREIEQFRRHGPGSPICIKPGLRSYLFLLFAGPLLIGGSVLALAKGGPLTFLAGLIGLPLSAFACLLYLVILLRSRRRGLIEFCNRGLYHALYRLDLAWSDIGPAWTYSLRAGGRMHEDVLFILRNASTYKPALGKIERILFAIMERQGRSASGGALDSALRSFAAVFGEAGAGSDTVGVLNEMRRRLSREPDAVVLSIPSLIRPVCPTRTRWRSSIPLWFTCLAGAWRDKRASVQPWLTCRWKGRPQHQKRTSLRFRTMNLKAGRPLIIRHTASPWRAIIFQALGLRGPNGLKTLEPRVR